MGECELFPGDSDIVLYVLLQIRKYKYTNTCELFPGGNDNVLSVLSILLWSQIYDPSFRCNPPLPILSQHITVSQTHKSSQTERCLLSFTFEMALINNNKRCPLFVKSLFWFPSKMFCNKKIKGNNKWFCMMVIHIPNPWHRVYLKKKGLNSLKSGTNESLEVGKKICLISNVSYLAKGEEVAGSETDWTLGTLCWNCGSLLNTKS